MYIPNTQGTWKAAYLSALEHLGQRSPERMDEEEAPLQARIEMARQPTVQVTAAKLH